ncbi:MAG: HAMP domain-containing sensor histidine kinase, partial [Gemmatimonadaceae bacterium]
MLLLSFIVFAAIGLALLAAFGTRYVSHESIRRLDARLEVVSVEAWSSFLREQDETPDSNFTYIAEQVTSEWSDREDAFLLLDSLNNRAATLDPDGFAVRVAADPNVHRKNAGQPFIFELNGSEPHLRARVVDTAVTYGATRVRTPFRIVSFISAGEAEADARSLGVLFGISLPIILVMSLVAGYLLAGRALQPVRDLGNAMAAIAPDDLNTRLAVEGGRGDEVSAVATEFNALLARLQEARARNVQFVREAAHQIRTPLTLVFGEASHALDAGNVHLMSDPVRTHATLTRIRSAAEAMRRRVDELFLLAESRTGETVRLEQQVELDGLVLECTDLMRARARDTGHRLAIGNADPAVVQGHASLLQEAVLEMLENACRYGSVTDAITVSCTVEQVEDVRQVVLAVSSGGAPFELPPPRGDENLNSGMGLSIVRWVASSHHAILRVVRRDEINHVEMVFTLV